MRRAVLLAASFALGLVAVACSSGGGASTPAAVTTPSGGAETPAATAAGATADGFAFPTGPAVVVEAGYAPPEDRVPSTGGYLPVNGKPTLVYVDAIW
ncbi:MAG: hypothetical protein AMXMBFR23_25550 [Chloroflexota bacterium]